jgi:hypothetical protein
MFRQMSAFDPKATLTNGCFWAVYFKWSISALQTYQTLIMAEPIAFDGNGPFGND